MRIKRPKVVVQNLEESQRDDHYDNIPSEIPEPRKEYPRTYNEAMQSRDIALWKEAIHDEIGSIMRNDMWALSDLPPGCKPLGIDKLFSNEYSHESGKPVDQLEYSRAIGYLMYAMTSTRPNIAYVVGRLSRFTSNPSRQHWKAITRVFKYLRGTKDYGLSYVGYPSVLEGYSDATWINHVKDSSSTSGWVFLLGEVPFHGLPRSKHASLVETWNLSL
nr:zinc finger, CCHC-type [Tanacetum cinerariifolium]